MFNNIDDSIEEYWGVVVSVIDPMQIGRIKVRVPNIYSNEIPEESLPWCCVKYPSKTSLDLPYVGEYVSITFKNNNRYEPLWNRFTPKREFRPILEEDYPLSTILFEKDFTQYDSTGHIRVHYTESEGFKIVLNKNDFDSTLNILPDNSIQISNGATDKHIHISPESISLGSLTKSEYSATLGEPTQESLTALNDMVKQLSEIMSDGLKQIGTAASTSPYTASIASPINTLSSKVKSEISSAHSDVEKTFPEILSKIVSLDKGSDE